LLISGGTSPDASEDIAISAGAAGPGDFRTSMIKRTAISPVIASAATSQGVRSRDTVPGPAPTVRPQLEQNRAVGKTGAPQPAQAAPSRGVPQLEQNLPAPGVPQPGQGRAETLMMPPNSCYMERLAGLA
jgi:hypothetical protein